jgi:integrase/recombinase XerD
MKVQRIRHPETNASSWIVLDDAYLPIKPILAYLKFLEDLGRSPHTRRAIAHHLKLFWEFLRAEQLDWKEVDIAHLATFISWLRRPDSATLSIAPHEAKRTDATIDQMLASVHGYYTFHMRLKTILQLPLYQFLSSVPRSYKPFLYGIAKAKPIQTRVVKVKRERRQVKTLTRDQVNQLIAACSHVRDKFLLTLLYETGMRIGQALGLRHADIRSEDNEIHIVPREDNANGARAKARQGYIIPNVPQSLMRLYTDYLIEDLGALSSDALPDFVFVNLWEGKVGHPMTYDAVMSLIRRLRKKTAIPVSPHQFRHTRATTWLRDDQLSLESTSALLGHASIETTRSIYDHRNMEDVKRELQAAKVRQGSSHGQ